MPRKPFIRVVVPIGVVVAAAGLYWFAPWKLFTNTTVHDALSTPAVAPSASAASAPGPASPSSAGPSSAGPAVLAQGAFVSHEHPTTGTARIVRAADGSRRLELANLATSDGPDLRVWLTERPAGTDAGGFNQFRHLELGRLKGNRGDQVYPISADAELSRYRSVTIWCIRFSVSFGAAELTPVPA
jgi:Electron transfer DM13